VAPLRYRRAYCRGGHESEVAGALEKLVTPGMTVADVGAHLGYFTLILARLAGPCGRVFAFEPLASHRRLLRRTLAINGLDQVTLRPEAVGGRTGGAILEEWVNSAMSRLSSGDPPTYCVRRHAVREIRLDDWEADERPARLDLVKLDVEGRETAALAGAAATLARHRPLLVLELHRRAGGADRAHELLERLAAAGYRCRPLEGGGVEERLRRLESLRLAGGDVGVLHLLARPG
jgi:FkbM family methyltransferase